MALKGSTRVLAVTPGDPAGIGPEIVWKAVQSGIEKKLQVRLLCVGAAEPFRTLGAPIRPVTEENIAAALRGKLPSQPGITLLSAPNIAPSGKPKKGFSLPGYQSGWSIEKAVTLVQQGTATALVTGPISKERFQAGGFHFPGHTEFLAHLCRTKGKPAPRVVMMLANEQLRIALVTTHLSLADVPRVLSRSEIERTVLSTVEHLRKWWKIKTPRVAVTALNPHAGEGGIFGNEELRIITPAIRRLRAGARGKFEISGPHPADTFFAKHVATPASDKNDAVVCMYHDQGLIPVKLIDFGGTVNVTLGLPIIRTSVDHGVGFDIAGKGLADPSSLLAAIHLAARLASDRRTPV